MKALVIGQFIEPPFAEGVTNVILNWSRALSQAHVDVKILSTSTKFSGQRNISNLNFEYLKTKSLRFQNTLRDCLRLQRRIVEESKEFDVIHYASNADGVSFLPSLSLLKTRNVKTVNSYHTDLLVKSTHLSRNLLFDMFTVSSRRMANLFKRRISPQKMRVISPCVDTEFFKPREKTWARRELGIAEDTFLFFTIGHFKRGRRLVPLVQTFRKLADRGVNFQLIVGWTGYGEEEEIKEIFSLSGKKDFLRIVPPTNRINLYYNAADVYILSASPSHVIETPMSVIEAMSSGVPVVGFNVNAVSEIVKNNESGCLIEDGNFEKLKSSLIRLVKDSFLLEQLSSNSRNLAVNRFSYKVIGNSLRSTYSKSMEN